MPIAASPFVAYSCDRPEGHTIRYVHDPEAGAVALFCEHCGLAEALASAIHRSTDHSPTTTAPAVADVGADSAADEIPF